MRVAKKRVLFVCMGNICRSPAAEAILKHRLQEHGLAETIEVDSAGTHDYHIGEPPDPRMRMAAARRGYQLDHIGRQFCREDFEQFDLILAMDRENLRDIRALDPRGRYRGKVRLLCDFIPDCKSRDVPDPYFGGSEGFEQVLTLLEQASEHILHYLRDGLGGKGPA